MQSNSRRILIVGGVAAGASAATKARRTDEDAEIVIYERGPYVSFANCGLPYYVGGEIKDLDDLLLMTPERFSERFRIQVELHHEVGQIDRANRRIEVMDLLSGEPRWEAYDRLILAPGGRPILPPIPGVDLAGISPLTTVPDAQQLRWMAQQGRVRQAVVIGAGFIGLETAEALIGMGLEVHVVEMAPQVLPPMDAEMAALVAAHLVEKGAQLHLGARAEAFVGNGHVEGVIISTGETVPAQIVVLAAGVRPELTLAKSAGLEIGPSGGVVVNERLETSDPAILACGDVAEVTNRITGQKVRVPLAGPANKAGRIAGANAAGANRSFGGVVGTSIVKVCDLSAGKTGLSEREARAAGYSLLISYTHPLDHAGYYPGAKRMTVKLLADRASGRILGAQIVGPTGVDKRIDVLATALHGAMTVEDLEELDLAYAPPYSSAKDPVIMAGFVAANEWRGEVSTITSGELAGELDRRERLHLVDVRTPAEYAEGHIPGAVNVPLDSLRANLDQLEGEELLTLYCGVGYRSYHAWKILAHHGRRVRHLSGGFTSWVQQYPRVVERPASEVSSQGSASQA